MSRFFALVLIAIFSISFSKFSQAQILVEDGEVQASQPEPKPRVGKSAATDYFKKRERAREAASEGEVSGSIAGFDRVMGIYGGTFLNDKAYRWGSKDRVDDPGKWFAGVNYRVGEWTKSMDLSFRAELVQYEIDDKKPLKLSLMPVISFPDARSDFPLYFGAGVGAGIFFSQAGDESDLSLDYALIVGARLPTLFDWGGLFMETGLKGQVFLFSSGQQDGVFLSLGGIFAF